MATRYSDTPYDDEPSPAPSDDEGGKAKGPASARSKKAPVSAGPSRARKQDETLDAGPEAFDAALEEHELLNTSHIWSEAVQSYAQEQRLRERGVEAAFNAQLAERQLDRALHITEWAGRSLDAIADRDHQASMDVAPGSNEVLSAAEEEKRSRRRESALEGWRKRREADEAQQASRQAAQARRLETKKTAKADPSKPKRPPPGYVYEPIGPDGHSLAPHSPAGGSDGTSNFGDSSVYSPMNGRGDGPSKRKRPRTERASMASTAATLAANSAMLEGLDQDDPAVQAYIAQHQLAQEEAAAAGLLDDEEPPSADERPDSPPLSPAMSAPPLDDDEEFREASTSKKGKSKPLKAPKPMSLEDDDVELRIWAQIAKTHIPKAKRILDQSIGSRLSFQKRLASIVQREAKRFLAKTRNTKEVQIRAKRVMREMLVFWRGNDKRDKERKTKAERAELDKVKKEEELREAKRAARKLNFLITQTELYSHFVGSKLKTGEAEESAETSAPSQVVGAAESSKPVAPMSAQAHTVNSDLKAIDFDDEDESNMQEHARRNAQLAAEKARQKASDFDAAAAAAFAQAGGDAANAPQGGSGAMVEINENTFDGDEMNFQNPNTLDGGETIKQPMMLNCQLKEYQVKGLTWLASLYDQGINGILADEMGLGKTVQSIALMAHLAETQNIWGPFLVIAPASTLHNWQQEISRFVPSLKALPYWGAVKDRTVLRKFWNRKAIRYDKDAPFHILVTSYQLVVADEKYFQRVKWQYMVLDEAQAIKSSSSARWKTLLGFHCRNRLLLTGTPIQNSMQELWALLHFIMPSLFDSHNEFSEWFSKDIEGGAEKGAMNEHQLRRLHMILKPFMLRRIKKNVQNELADKVEIDVMCDLTPRQKFMYNTLRTNISLADLVRRAQSLSVDDSTVKRLMNLIMQFRKVCNHPELFERADVKAPFALCGFAESGPLTRDPDFLDLNYSTTSTLRVDLPRLLTNELQVGDDNTDTSHLKRMMSIWRPSWSEPSSQNDGFGFARLLNLNGSDLETLAKNDSEPLERLRIALREQRRTTVDDNIDADQRRSPFLLSSKTTGLPADLLNVEADFRQGSRLRRDDMHIYLPSAIAPPAELVCNDRAFATRQAKQRFDPDFADAVFGLPFGLRDDEQVVARLDARVPDFPPLGILGSLAPEQVPQAPMLVPQLQKLILDSGKLARLDKLLHELRQGDHRVLVYFQMTRMIDLMEEYLAFRGYKYLRLDGSSTISERRDMVTDWQTKPDIFIFLLSTRAGGLGINLTAADTVIFYDSDWNPSNDAQAMDRAHRLGQTKQVTVYRLITQGTIDERILKMARNKKSVQDAVVGSSNASLPTGAAPQSTEVMSLLLDDAELEETVRQAQLRRERAEQKQIEDGRKGAAQREANKKAAAAAQYEQSQQMASGLTGFGIAEDDDDAFGFFAPPTNNGMAGDPEDELGVAKASEAATTTTATKGKGRAKAPPKLDANGQPIPPVKRKRAPNKPKVSIGPDGVAIPTVPAATAVGPDGQPPAKKPRKPRGPTKKQKEAAAAAAAAAAGAANVPQAGPSGADPSAMQIDELA